MFVPCSVGPESVEEQCLHVSSVVSIETLY